MCDKMIYNKRFIYSSVVILLVSLLGIFMYDDILAQSPCNTPIECYEKALKKYQQAITEMNAAVEKVDEFQHEINALKDIDRKISPIGSIFPYIGMKESFKTTGSIDIENAIKKGYKVWVNGHSNWFLCNGATIPEGEYSTLLVDSSDSNGFQLPDLRDRFLMGANPWSSKPAPTEIGKMGGEHEIPKDGKHIHDVTVGDSIDGGGNVCSTVHTHRVEGKSDEKGDHNHGGENRPPFYSVWFIIRIK